MVSTAGCNQSLNKEFTFDQLFSSINTYNNKNIRIEGFYFQGWETIVLSEKLELSEYAEGHFVPKGRMIWVSGGISKELYDKLNQQQKIGPLERFGKVKITGKFEYGRKYGHLGGYDQQITPTETIILPWSPPASVTSEREGFAIFLTKEDIPPSRMKALSYVEIADQPIISIMDIITYDAQTHEITLTENAFNRIADLEVPVQGRSFIVCVDRSLIYWGAFWTPISSMSFGGVTIWKPLNSQEPRVITLELGYPSPSFYKGEDPRNNAEVIESLEQAGKLINELSITSIDKLPHSMKGYELYSWSEDNQWHFTIITGTNRNKTLEEITSQGDYISESGWVKAHVVSVDAIKDVLSQLPQNEHVSWCEDEFIILPEPAEQTNINLQLPPKQIIDTIKEHADRLEVSSQIVPNGDNVTFTHTCNIAVKNVGPSTVMVETVGFGLPGGFTYVNGSSFWNGVSIENPDVDGNKLSWDIESLGNAPRKLVSEAIKTQTFRVWGTGTINHYSWAVANDPDIGTVSSCTAYKITAQAGGTNIEAYMVKNEGSVSPASWKIN